MVIHKKHEIKGKEKMERESFWLLAYSMTLKTRDWFTKFNAIFREVLLFFLKEVCPLKL